MRLRVCMQCGSWDLTGRYVVPLVIALPFFLAAVVMLLWFPSTETDVQAETTSVAVQQSTSLFFFKAKRLRSALLIALLLVYSIAQGYAYGTSSSHNTFQTSGCVSAPADATALITYIQQQHIHYALPTSWIGDPLTFKTNGKILVTSSVEESYLLGSTKSRI